MRRPGCARIRRSKRNTNSAASSAKQTGSGASSHHSGNTRFLMVMRAEHAAVDRHLEAVAHHHQADREARRTSAERLHQPGDARRHERQHEIDPHMLAAAQQPRRGEQRHEVERVFGDFVGPGESGARQIAQHDVGGHHDDHREQRQRRENGERVEQLGEERRRGGSCECAVPSAVIPGRAGGANPESSRACGVCNWIPALRRFAAPRNDSR